MSNKTATRILVTLSVSVGIVVVTATQAAATRDENLGRTLGVLWEAVLETPTPDNPFAGGDPCVDLGGIVAPFAPLGPSSATCTVKPGTKIFVTAESSECSTVEDPPFFGANQPELRSCARAADTAFAIPTITLDGKPVPVREVETGLLAIDLPDTNILGISAQTAFSAGHGWVALLNPLTPGTHHITLRVVGTDVFGNTINLTNPTTIIVKPSRECTSEGTPQSCAVAVLKALGLATDPATPDTDTTGPRCPALGTHGFCVRYFGVGFHIVSIAVPCPPFFVVIRRR